MSDFPVLALFDEALASLEEYSAQLLDLYDAQGLEAVAELAAVPSGTLPGSFVFVSDDNGVIVMHHREELIGASIVSDIGRDTFGYPWHERFLGLPSDGGLVVIMNPVGSDNEIVWPSDAESELSVFDAWRAERLMYRMIAVVPHDGLRFALVTQPIPAGLINTAVLDVSAILIATGGDMGAASDLVIQGVAGIEALVDAGRWHGDSSDAEQFVGFVAGPNGVIVNSYFDPSTVGQRVADILGPDALGSAAAGGARYLDESRGVDVTLVATPQGFIVGGGVAGR